MHDMKTDTRHYLGWNARLRLLGRVLGITALFAALKNRPPDGGLWTGPKVAVYVRDRWGVSVRPQTGWRWLVDLGFTLQVPRPSHPNSATPAGRRAWKKTCDAGSGG